MKVARIVKQISTAIVLATLCGCATETRYSPPADKFAIVLAEYNKLQNPKVMVVAIDRPYSGGEQSWAFGYSDGKTIEDATKKANDKCKKAAWHNGVFAKRQIFAINDDVIYYKEEVK